MLLFDGMNTTTLRLNVCDVVLSLRVITAKTKQDAESNL
jgi:hypothetical protein